MTSTKIVFWKIIKVYNKEPFNDLEKHQFKILRDTRAGGAFLHKGIESTGRLEFEVINRFEKIK
jgi:hypothetical protein